MADTRIQEIFTQAIVGRAESRIRWEHAFEADDATGVLGVQITDSAVAVRLRDDQVVVEVRVELDLWVAEGRQTRVIRAASRRTEDVEVPTFGTVIGDLEVQGRPNGMARATEVAIEDGEIVITFEIDVNIVLSGLARLWVQTFEMDDENTAWFDPDGSSGTSDSSSSSSDSVS